MKFSNVALIVLFSFLVACSKEPITPVSASGVTKASVSVSVGSDGLTVEQRNVKDRLALDNKPGSIKHLYVISAFSGEVLIYSTVRGKVTSSGKRLNPYKVAAINIPGKRSGMVIQINGEKQRTGEVLQDDGTYGSSIPYLFWWDQSGRYHQHYISGGQIIHISDTPLNVKRVTLNMELTGE